MIDEKRLLGFKAAWDTLPPQVRAGVLVDLVRKCTEWGKVAHRDGLAEAEMNMPRRELISHSIRDAYAVLASLAAELVNEADAECEAQRPDTYVPFKKEGE